MGVSGQVQALAALPPGKQPQYQFTGDWDSSRIGLEVTEKSLLLLLEIKPRFLGRLAPSQATTPNELLKGM
jgi:hypothetical protein